MLRGCRDCPAWAARDEQVQLSLGAPIPKSFGGSGRYTVMLKDVFPFTLECHTSTPAFLHSDSPAHLIPLAWLSYQTCVSVQLSLDHSSKQGTEA